MIKPVISSADSGRKQEVRQNKNLPKNKRPRPGVYLVLLQHAMRYLGFDIVPKTCSSKKNFSSNKNLNSFYGSREVDIFFFSAYCIGEISDNYMSNL